MNQKSRKKLLDKCGLPDIPETQHCFNDSTHHTCCEIGPLARNYADSSDNPNGNLADNYSNNYQIIIQRKHIIKKQAVVHGVLALEVKYVVNT